MVVWCRGCIGEGFVWNTGVKRVIWGGRALVWDRCFRSVWDGGIGVLGVFGMGVLEVLG